MKGILTYISGFYKSTFNWFYFLTILLMLSLLIYLNYWHFLEIKIVNFGESKVSHWVGYYLLYFIPFASAFLLQLFFFKDCQYFKKSWFWIILLVAPAIFACKVNFDVQETAIKKYWEGDLQEFWIQSLNWVVRVLIVLMLIFIVWFIKDRKSQPFYGIKATGNLKPYIWMLLFMIPLIAIASTQKDFLAMYPKAHFLMQLDIPSKKWHYFIYELCYGFDFVSIEFFFRGFLILSLLKICGNHCIIPVACFYCTIHFGKPMGEAISSFWGGLLLGIISMNTGSVWGGLLVHLGIAWLMELGGWLGLLWKT